jgi:heptosyltransferase-2
MSTVHDPRPRTVVLLQFTGIGDLIWHIHYFKMLAERSHGGRLTVVAQPSTLAKAFMGGEPWVEKIIDHDHRPRRGEKRRGRHAGLAGMYRMACELREGKYDRIIVFSGRISRGLIAYLSAIPTRMGFGYRRLQRLCLNQGPYIPAHAGPSVAVFHEASAFMVAHGYCQAPVVPRLEPPADLVNQMRQRLAGLPRPLYAFAIGTSEVHKQWGAANFGALARRITEAEAGSVLLLGGPAETQLANDIAAMLPEGTAQTRLAIITDASPLGSAAALRVADACVGNDTGMTNVAAAVGTHSLVLLGSRPPLEHDPIYLHNMRAADLSDITAEQVMTVLRSAPFTDAAHP